MTQVVVAGASHRLCLQSALALLPSVQAEALTVLGDPAAYQPPDEDYWRAAIEGQAPLGFIWDGNQHNVRFLLPGQPLVVFGSRARTERVHAQVVPFMAVRELWAGSLRELAEWMMRARRGRRVFVVGTPPPKPDHQVREGLAREEYFTRLLAKWGIPLEEAPICDEQTRVALWESLQEAMAQLCAGEGVEFVPVPGQTQTSSGALKPELCSQDATHANAQYGLLMWGQIARTLGLWS